MREWKGIVIHHSETADNSFLPNIEAIKKYHIEVNKWQDIGYHYVIEKVNNNYVVEIGRDINTIGSHALGFNATHIGICCIGNFNITSPESEMYLTLKNLLVVLKNTYSIENKNIIGHIDTYGLLNKRIEKTCPGIKFEMKKIF